MRGGNKKKMEIDKITVGLIAGIIVGALMAFALPAMAAHEATQSANVTKSTTFEFYNQTGVSTITTLNIVGTVGEELTGSGLYNNVDGSGSPQNISDANAAIARIKNTDTDTNLAAWAKVTEVANWDVRILTEHFLLTATGSKPADAAAINKDLSTWGTEVDASYTVDANTFANLWIKVVPQTTGTGSSTFTVLGEGA